MQTRLVRLHDLIADDADLMRQFDDLEPLIDHDAASLAADLSPVEARFADGRLPQPLAAGIVRTATISGMVDRMLEHERTLLAGTRDATEQRISELLGSGMVIRGGFVVLLIIVYYAVRRGARRSEELATARFDALQASEQRFHRMFEQCPVGIVLAEPDGVRVVQANPAFCRLLGYDAETVTGKALADFIHVDDRGAVPEAVEAATTPDMLGVEARHVTRNGTVAWTRIRMARMGDAGDRSALLLALISDLTREKRVEAELRQAQKWKRSVSSPAASRTISTICSA